MCAKPCSLGSSSSQSGTLTPSLCYSPCPDVVSRPWLPLSSQAGCLYSLLPPPDSMSLDGWSDLSPHEYHQSPSTNNLSLQMPGIRRGVGTGRMVKKGRRKSPSLPLAWVRIPSHFWEQSLYWVLHPGQLVIKWFWSRRGSGSAVCEGGYWDDWQGGTQTLLFAESVTSYLPPSPLVWSVLPLSPKKSTPRAHNTPVQKPLPPTKSSWHMLTPPMQPTLIPWCCTDYYTQLCSPLLQCWAQSCLTHGL